MVLQTNTEYGARSFLNGKAKPGEKVVVSVGKGGKFPATADATGEWAVQVRARRKTRWQVPRPSGGLGRGGGESCGRGVVTHTHTHTQRHTHTRTYSYCMHTFPHHMNLPTTVSPHTISLPFPYPPHPVSPPEQMLGGKGTITVTGEDGPAVVAHNVSNGDVFFCSGQSNMVFPMSLTINATDEIATLASYPQFRFFFTAVRLAVLLMRYDKPADVTYRSLHIAHCTSLTARRSPHTAHHRTPHTAHHIPRSTHHPQHHIWPIGILPSHSPPYPLRSLTHTPHTIVHLSFSLIHPRSERHE